MDQLTQALINLLIVVIGLFATFVGQEGKKFLKKKGLLAEMESKKKYVDIVVKALQQTYAAGEGEAKAKEAKDELVSYFVKNGINFTHAELDLLIESAVKGMKDGIKKGDKK